MLKFTILPEDLKKTNNGQEKNTFNIAKKINQILKEKETRKKYRAKNKSDMKEDTLLSEKEFTDFINKEANNIFKICDDIFKEKGKKFKKPKINFFENEIEINQGEFYEGSILYLQDNNSIYIKTLYNNEKIKILGNIAHEIGHSLQNQTNNLDIFNKVQTEKNADLLSGYILKILGKSEDELYKYGYSMANIGNNDDLVNLLSNIKRTHGTGRERKKYVYKGYYSKLDDILNILDKKNIEIKNIGGPLSGMFKVGK